jgi:hypothetical protein
MNVEVLGAVGLAGTAGACAASAVGCSVGGGRDADSLVPADPSLR